MAVDAVTDPLSASTAPKRRSRMNQIILMGSHVWSWAFLALLVVYFAWKGTGFFSLRNSQNILVNIVSIALMGLGQTFVIISGGIDLSVGWVMGFSSVVSAKTIRDSYNAGVDPDLAILMGLGTGLGVALLVGLTSGLIIAKLKIPPFIVTLGVSFVARGIGFLMAKGNVISGQPRDVSRLGNESLFYYVRGEGGGLYFLHKPEITGQQLRMMDKVFTWPVLIAFAVVLVGMFVLARTQFGRHTYAIGGNREASMRAGVLVDRQIILLYMLSAGTAGLAGVMHAWRFSGGAADAGDALMMLSIAAVFIGGVSMSGGQGRVVGTVIGALILAVLQTGLIMTNVKTFYQYVIVGIIVILAVLMDQARDLIVGRAEAE